MDSGSNSWGAIVHFVGRAADLVFAEPQLFAGRSSGYRQSALIDRTLGSLHTCLTLNELRVEGVVPLHMRSCEEGFYVLAGEVVLSLGDQSFHLRGGDYGLAKVGVIRGWRAVGETAARWLQLTTPHPRPAGAERDTFFPATGEPSLRAGMTPPYPGPVPIGRFDVSDIPPPGAVRSGVSALPGVFLQWMIDEAFGARHHRMLLIEYQPDVGIATHDHTFEEAYYILSGEIQATLDGTTYLAGPGDVIWTGVGCAHSFVNISSEPVRWLETFAPQPPSEDVFRFFADWEARGAALESKLEDLGPSP